MVPVVMRFFRIPDHPVNQLTVPDSVIFPQIECKAAFHCVPCADQKGSIAAEGEDDFRAFRQCFFSTGFRDDGCNPVRIQVCFSRGRKTDGIRTVRICQKTDAANQR